MLDSGESTRQELSDATGLSRPTVTDALNDLEAVGLATIVRRAQTSGRSAAVYDLSPRAGWVLGIDAGMTRVRVAGRDLHGNSAEVAIDPDLWHTEYIPTVQQADLGGLRGLITANSRIHGPLRAIAIAIPTTVATGGVGMRQDVRTEVECLVEQLRFPLDADLVLENNVKCAAFAELQRGAAQGRANMTYVQIGVGLGIAFVIDRTVARGEHGEAGEIGRLPFALLSGDVAHGTVEDHLAAGGLIRMAATDWADEDSPAPATAADLFARAADQTPSAQRMVQRYAEQIGGLIVYTACTFDPGLIVLGGGIGENQTLLPGVRAVVARWSPLTDIRPGTLGSSATVQGAVELAGEHARARLIGTDRQSRLGISINSRSATRTAPTLAARSSS